MPSYVVLGNYTDQGVQDMRDLGPRLAAARDLIEAAGGKLISWYLTFGPYDFVAVTEVPSLEVGAGITLALGAQGNIRTLTMQALTEDEAAAVVTSAMPSPGLPSRPI